MALWTPANLATAPRLWIDGDDAVFSGSNLSSIAAKGADGGAMTVSGTPTKVTLNGLNGALFDSTSEYLSRTLGAWSSGYLYALVFFKPITIANYPGLLHNGGGVNASGVVTISIGSSTVADSTMFILGNGYANAPRMESADGDNLAEAAQSVIVGMGGSPNVFRRNGASDIARMTSHNSTAAIPSYGSMIWGFGHGWAGETASAEVYQIVLLDYAPSSADIERFEGWSHWKYGAEADLPAGHPYKSAAPTTGAYSLSCAGGSFAPSGQAAGLKAARRIALAQGAFVETGESVGLRIGRRLAAADGAFGEAGQAASLRCGRAITAAAGSFALSGQAATLTHAALRRLTAEAGLFTLGGRAAALKSSNLWQAVGPSPEAWSAAAADPETWTPVPATAETWSAA